MNIWISLVISLFILGVFRKYFFRATNLGAFTIDIMLVVFLTTAMWNCHGDRFGSHSTAATGSSIASPKDVLRKQEESSFIRLDAERNRIAEDWNLARIWNANNGDEVYCKFTNTTDHPIWVVLDGQPRTIQIGQGPVNLSGKLEVKIANGYEKRFVAVKSTDGFLGRTLRVSIPTPDGSSERVVTTTDRMSVEQNLLPPTHRQNSESAIAGSNLPAQMPPLTKIGRFPETQHNLLTDAYLRQMTSEDLRYAINEMYARHGAWFNKADVRANFVGSSWYKPKKGLSFDEIEKEFSTTELNNLHILSARRQQSIRPNLDAQTFSVPEKKLGNAHTPAKKRRETLRSDGDFNDLDRY